MTTQETLAEELEENFTVSEESLAALQGQDLSKGYRINTSAGDINVKPNGRPASFVVYGWDGRESKIPIQYDAGGQNPRIDRYLRKRHCNACSMNGFIGRVCPYCASPDIIPLYYVRKADVPYKRNFYGNIPCLFSQEGAVGGDCPRQRDLGFLDETQMMMHAAPKHQREYGIWRDTNSRVGNTGGNQSEVVAELMRQVAELTNKLQGVPAVVASPEEGGQAQAACPKCSKIFEKDSPAQAESAVRMHMRHCKA